jgi:hypothetical protein
MTWSFSWMLIVSFTYVLLLKFVSTACKRKEREETPVGVRKKLWESIDSEERVPVVTPAQEEPEPVRPLLQERIKNVSKKAPAVPCTPSRTIRKNSEPPRTPEGELSSRSCDHQDWVIFQDWNQAYYTEDWLKRETAPERYPLVCSGSGCGRRFVHKPPDGCNLDKVYKVTNKGPVHVCPNAAKGNHQCTFALCHKCFEGLLSGMFQFDLLTEWNIY